MEQYKSRKCPWWLGYLLIIPIRKYWHNPHKMLSPHIKEGMNIVDFGCAMGYFSLPLAQLTGSKGTVYCIDIQEQMLSNLQKRANKAGIQNIKPLLVGKNYNPEELKNSINFIMLFAVVHEVPNKEQLFIDLFTMAKPGCKILFSEPEGHVSRQDFNKSLLLAQNAGFIVENEKPISKGLSAFLVK